MTEPVNSPGLSDPPLPGGGALQAKLRHYIFLVRDRLSRVNLPLLYFVLIGGVLELLYLMVFALAPLSTIHPMLSPVGMDWHWTLAPSQLLFPGAWNLHGKYTVPGSYFLWLGVTFIALTSVYLYAVRRASHASNKLHITSRWLLLPLIGAIIFGITLLFLPAFFSNEVYNYIFSGRMLNIYHVDPMSTVPAQFPRDPYFAWISQPNVPNIYGPLWLIIASLLMGVSNSPVATLLLFKGLALLSHLINCALIWIILGKLAPARRLLGTLLYAWNPLALIELAGNGYNDGVLICLLLLATWLYAQQKGGWYDVAAVVLLGLAISVNCIGLLFAPFFIWFSLRSEDNIMHAIWGFCWRTILALAVLFTTYLPFWHGGSTFVAIISSIDMQHFVHSPLAVLVMPIRWLYSSLTQSANISSTYIQFVQPIAAADTTVISSTIFIFVLIYFYLLGKARSFDQLFTSLSIAILAYMLLVSASFWPWYVLWALWAGALRRYDALTVSVLLLSCTALLTYPFLYLDSLPIAAYQSLLIFGIPFVYLIVNGKKRNERNSFIYDRRSETA